MTLTEFLLARIAEDESMARRAQWEGDSTPGTSYRIRHGLGAPPPRVLAECEAKRRIVGIYSHIDMGEGLDGEMIPLGGDGPEVYYNVCRHLAAVYADHPDYDETWRP